MKWQQNPGTSLINIRALLSTLYFAAYCLLLLYHIVSLYFKRPYKHIIMLVVVDVAAAVVVVIVVFFLTVVTIIIEHNYA